jgi:site-specific recombinase XerD
MARRAKPFIRRGFYVTKLGGNGKLTKLVPVAAGLEAAEIALLELQLRLKKERPKPVTEITVRDLCERFMDTVEVEKSHNTYLDYQQGLQRFLNLHEDRRVRDITKVMVLDFRDGMSRKGYKPKTVNNALIGLKACWNWGNKFDLVAENPFKGVELLHAEGRQRLVTDEEYRRLLAHADTLFRELLIVFRQTPARQQDVRNLTWPMMHFDHHVWVIHRHKGTRTARVKKPRIIPMSPATEKLLLRRRKRFGHQPYVFLNEDGQPWKKDALCLRMRRCRERAGILPDTNDEQLVLYSHRHTYLTNAAASGISAPILQDLGGWTTIKMAETYVHNAFPDLYEAGLKTTARLGQRRK